LARPDFRAAAARRLSEERELSPAIVSLLSPERTGPTSGVRRIPLDRITPNPENPRITFEEAPLDELAASIREHGILQPVLVRPVGESQYQLIAGERRWRAAKLAGLAQVPALVEEIDDDTALEIAIIENLQREDLSPLEEAAMYDRMIRDHGYSIRKLAGKLGKDKGYLENRLRLADAPEEVRELVSLRKDTISHAYELMKVADPKKRRKLTEQVARGELTLIKLRERIEGRRTRRASDPESADLAGDGVEAAAATPEATAALDDAAIAGPASEAGWAAGGPHQPLREDSLITAKQDLAAAVEGLVDVLRSPDVVQGIGEVDRANLAKYLTIAKLKLENAITLVRSGRAD
jgi:ParB family chromosome partitioning protein